MGGSVSYNPAVASNTEQLEDLRPPSPGRLFGLVRPYMRPLILATALMMLSSAIGLLAPWVAGNVVDAALLEQSLSQLNRVVMILIGLFAAMGIVTFFEVSMLRGVGARLLLGLRRRLYSKLVTFAPDFFESRRIGELISRFGSDLEVVQGTLTEQIPSGIQAVLRFAGVLIILFVLHTRLTVVALAVVPPVVLVALAFGKRLEKIATREQDAVADMAAEAEESLSGIRTVQSFGREPQMVRRYDGALERLLGVELKAARMQGGFSGLILFAAFSAFALVLWYGGNLMLEGRLTPGELTAFLLYTFTVAASVGELGSLYAGYRELKGASARIFSILDTRASIEDSPDALPLDGASGRITFKDVSFGYPAGDGRLALDGIDLEIRPGETVGLVGPSGAGKTTVFSLLQRFFDPSSGSIELDETDLRSIRLRDLRRVIAAVPQDIFLFSGTVAENILFGNPEAGREQVQAAAVAAGADAFIREFPDGYEERVGERGVKLSGGQRQRIAIARAFLADPAILLLDEATSFLDPDSEEQVRQTLANLWRGRTTLVIAHRLATARQADRILIFDGGRVVASGTHDSLIDANAIYRRYWELQSSRDEPER